jgi:hypothetical protein
LSCFPLVSCIHCCCSKRGGKRGLACRDCHIATRPNFCLHRKPDQVHFSPP